MANGEGWRNMSTAPKDGTPVLVTVRPVEQGPADVDTAFWSAGDEYGPEGWRAADSEPGKIIAYAEVELKCWMPLPDGVASADSIPAAMPSPWMGSDATELDGSGI